MNKEVTITTRQIKQAIDDLVDERDELQQKVNQLETNRDEAIEEIKYFELQADHLDDSIYLDKTLSNKLISILERGKE